ncbi:redox-sensitive transcriptional activator SoxR [Dinoroseobacter sp. S375]|uniref:redox-sensitive transcriptional activator SoxR n=1 Tax=Dinoroseobacter sp. S375 TaxID=3415136 RepID=UPI003C7CC5AB
MPATYLSIGQLSHRSGVPISTLHFYERKGLIASERNAANHRIYRRELLRRVTIVKVAQRAGLTLAEIEKALSHLPMDTVPNTAEWARLADIWHDDLTRRIETLTALRDKMAICIGCGCLSVERCALANPDDRLGKEGPGARYIPDMSS